MSVIGENILTFRRENGLSQEALAEKVGLPVVYDGSDQKTNDFGLYDDPGLPQLEHTLQRYPGLKAHRGL